jgi:hypothetical protein
MEITLPLLNATLPDNRFSDEFKKDFVYKCRINILPFEEDWVTGECQHAFGVWIEYGEYYNNTFLFEADLNDLEMFAYSLIKRIEIVRRDYSEVIKDKIKNGDNL